MTKIVINVCFGGFGLSPEALAAYEARTGKTDVYDRDIARDDFDLVAIVEEMGAAANNRYSSLNIVEIPDDVQWEIKEYDGNEHVAEVHRTWS